MSDSQPGNTLHGVTLQRLLARLVERHGREEPGRIIDIRCFTHGPGIKSSLRFPRKTPRVMKKAEALYLRNPGSRGGVPGHAAAHPGPAAGSHWGTSGMQDGEPALHRDACYGPVLARLRPGFHQSGPL